MEPWVRYIISRANLIWLDKTERISQMQKAGCAIRILNESDGLMDLGLFDINELNNSVNVRIVFTYVVEC
jgi:hypothetical protein